MKLTQRDFPARIPQVARDCHIMFFCGPDEAGASAAARAVMEQLPDAGERVELNGADLRSDPARLGDEARSSSLFGATRHLFVRVNGDEAHDAVQTLLQTGDGGSGQACPVVIVAAAATDKSRTAKLLEKRREAAVAMFWPPDLRSVTQSIRMMGDAAGVRLTADLAERIARGSGLDIRLAQSEVEKLATFLDASPQSPRTADAQALLEIGASTEEEGLMGIVNAALSGDLVALPGEIGRMRELAINPVGLLLAIERRVAQIAQLAARIGARGDIAQMLEAEQKARRIFWRDRADLERQLRVWRTGDLARLIARVAQLHRELMVNSQAAELLLAHGLTGIARVAAARR